MGMADAMVAKGLDKLGYIYVAIDCGWNLHTRDAKGDLQPDPKKFPDGIGAVARYVNGLGDGQLRLGLYSEHDTGDCCGGPGMKGHEDQDAAFYKANGIDYLKVDSCAGHTLTPRAMYNDFVSAGARARLDLSTSGLRCWRALLACAAGLCWSVLPERDSGVPLASAAGSFTSRRIEPLELGLQANIRDALNRTGHPVYLNICPTLSVTDPSVPGLHPPCHG